MRFIDQFHYEFGMRREFPGSFSLDGSNLTLRYDNYETTTYTCQLGQTSLALRVQPYPPRNLIRLSNEPSPSGWSKKLSVISELDLSGLSAYVMSLCQSDSGTVALLLRSGGQERNLVRITSAGTTIYVPAPGINAIEARGPHLWVATDSTIVKRTLFDPTVLSSFRYREVAGSDYRATGIALDSVYCYLMTIGSIDHRAKLLIFTTDGRLVGVTITSVVFKDLALAAGRLFVSTGDETFCELNPATGYASINCNIKDRFFGNNIEGIAFTGSTILLANRDRLGLRLTHVNVP